MFCVRTSSFISYLSYMSALVFIFNISKRSCFSDEFVLTASFQRTKSLTLSAIVKTHFNMYQKHFGIRVWHLTNHSNKKRVVKIAMCSVANHQQVITSFAHHPYGGSEIYSKSEIHNDLSLTSYDSRSYSCRPSKFSLVVMCSKSKNTVSDLKTWLRRRLAYMT